MRNKMKNTNISWVEQYKQIIEEHGHFGHNTDFDFLPAFKMIDKLGGTLYIKDYYTITILLPEDTAKSNKLLLYMLTHLPGITYAKIYPLAGKQKPIQMEWHY